MVRSPRPRFYLHMASSSPTDLCTSRMLTVALGGTPGAALFPLQYCGGRQEQLQLHEVRTSVTEGCWTTIVRHARLLFVDSALSVLPTAVDRVLRCCGFVGATLSLSHNHVFATSSPPYHCSLHIDRLCEDGLDPLRGAHTCCRRVAASSAATKLCMHEYSTNSRIYVHT